MADTGTNHHLRGMPKIKIWGPRKRPNPNGSAFRRIATPPTERIRTAEVQVKVDPLLTATPDIGRMVREAKAKLREAGLEVFIQEHRREVAAAVSNRVEYPEPDRRRADAA